MTGWSIVVPVKRLERAKSRLRATLAARSGPSLLPPGEAEIRALAAGDWHAAVALAMAVDTVTAVLAAPLVDAVIVVTDDRRATAALSALGAICVADVPGGGLNEALRHGAAAAPRGAGVASLGADLPALRSDQLDAALAAARQLGTRAFVADAMGTGTTLLAAPAGTRLEPAYGVGSATRHADRGAHPLSTPWPTLRQDVDTAADLAAARLLGLGPRTAALVGIEPGQNAAVAL